MQEEQKYESLKCEPISFKLGSMFQSQGFTQQVWLAKDNMFIKTSHMDHNSMFISSQHFIIQRWFLKSENSYDY